MEIIGVFSVLIFAAIEDVRYRKIRNAWVGLVFLLQIVMNLNLGIEACGIYLIRSIAWLGLLLIFYFWGMLGAGDVKLLSVILGGFTRECLVLFLSAFLGSAGVIALWKLFKGGTPKETVPLALPVWIGYSLVCLTKGGMV